MLAALPLALLVIRSLGRQWLWPNVLPQTWDLRAWAYVFSSGSGAVPAVGTSAGIAAVVALTAVAAALPSARVLAWSEFPGKRVLLFLLLLPVLSPPFAAAMGLHAAFLRLGAEETAPGVVLVHLIPSLPYAILMLTGSFSRLDPDLELQARTLGATPAQVFWKVTLPVIAPGAAAAMTFAFLISWSQYLLTLLVGGGRVTTLPLVLVSILNGGDQTAGAALTLIFVLPAIAVFTVISRRLHHEN